MKTEDKRFLIIVAFNAIAFAADGLVNFYYHSMLLKLIFLIIVDIAISLDISYVVVGIIYAIVKKIMAVKQ